GRLARAVEPFECHKHSCSFRRCCPGSRSLAPSQRSHSSAAQAGRLRKGEGGLSCSVLAGERRKDIAGRSTRPRIRALRAIVTGGAGFIGSHVVDALLARGDDVHVLDNLTTGSRDFVSSQAVLHEGDIRTDAAQVFEAATPEVCFHLAAQADVGTSVERPAYDADVNVVGTISVLEAARAHGTQVVFSSTGGAIYGECDRPAREDSPRRPVSPYGIAKLAAEEYLAGWNR